MNLARGQFGRRSNLHSFTCDDGVDGRTQNHHFCQSPFSTIHRTLDRHCNEVDCNEAIWSK